MNVSPTSMGHGSPVVQMPQPPPYPRAFDNQSDGQPKNQAPFFTASSFNDYKIRRHFVAKVYCILFAQLSLTAACVAMCMSIPSVCVWIRRYPVFLYVAYGVFLTTYGMLVCCTNARRSHPGNLIALFVFTLAMSYLAATIACRYTTVSVLTTFLITSASCAAISMFAVCGCVDFTRCSSFLFVSSIGLFLFGLACIIVYIFLGRNKILHAVYGGVAAILFMLYLAYDTQLVVGRHAVALSPEEYVLAAAELYIDVMNLFLILLGLVGEQD
ncbi:putative recs1 protein (Responsive to centrifugal force and shear stressprotein 1 protein) [Fasciola hepatica]|uniref:Recs1 protein (Responsive to centrifugal force and shear stressprotein 1 protein) n=1 Tax=Fasciola hepatica TaxID=6192 RepID=A0A4E0QYN4_FASHE|nr:putative recs1 protein (Responsive to centrifugal force and shear stressprotein 1 protein) [Fasciola hepatica]